MKNPGFLTFQNNAILAAGFMLLVLSTACGETNTRVTAATNNAPAEPQGAKKYQASYAVNSLIVLFKKEVSKAQIKELDNTLPPHSSKSLNSSSMFSYQFFNNEDFETGKNLLNKSKIVKDVSRNRVTPLNPPVINNNLELK